MLTAASASVKPSAAVAATAKPAFKPLHLPPLPAAGALLRPLSLSVSARPLYRQEHVLATVAAAAGRSDRASSPAPPAATADGARPVVEVAAPAETARRAKIGVYFATWWALNVIFNIYNKKVLNAFPYPWLTSTLSLAAGSAIMLASWATRIAEPPQTDLDFWKALSPVSGGSLHSQQGSFPDAFYMFLRDLVSSS
jgi:solute carrier family 35 protein E1